MLPGPHLIPEPWIGSLAARLNDVWWANLRFGFGISYVLSVVWLCTWSQVLGFTLYLYIWSGNLCMVSGNLYLAMVSCIILVHQLTWFHLCNLFQYLVLYPTFQLQFRYCTFQLCVHLYFHFLALFLLSILVLTSALQSCSVLSPRCNALLYRFRIYHLFYLDSIDNNPLPKSLQPPCDSPPEIFERSERLRQRGNLKRGLSMS